MLVTEINPNDELWLSEVEAPQIITDPNLFAWDDEADLVVAGLGGAGIAAANEALDQNLTVIGVDKTSGGGATAKSGGVFYAGGGTPIQLAAGVNDSPENMFNYLIQETGDIVKPMLLESNYLGALHSLVMLRTDIDTFFEDVLVNCEDEAVQQNRIAILWKLRALFTTVADISLIHGN